MNQGLGYDVVTRTGVVYVQPTLHGKPTLLFVVYVQPTLHGKPTPLFVLIISTQIQINANKKHVNKMKY